MSEHNIGEYEISNEKIQDLLTFLCHQTNRICPVDHVFVILLASIGEGGNLFYGSNGNREDIQKVMAEFIQKTTEN